MNKYDVAIYWKGNPSKPIRYVSCRANSEKEAEIIAEKSIDTVNEFAEGAEISEEF